VTKHDLTLISGPGAIATQRYLSGAHLIDGQWIDERSTARNVRAAFTSNGELVSEAALGSESEVEAAVAAARVAFDDGRWSDVSGKDRARCC
jgi:betaine-aldehyde dehydrogenase